MSEMSEYAVVVRGELRQTWLVVTDSHERARELVEAEQGVAPGDLAVYVSSDSSFGIALDPNKPMLWQP